MRRKFIILSTYALAVTLVLGTFYLKERCRADYLERQAAHNYSHAFAEVATGLEDMSIALDKALYAGSPSMVSSVCTEAYAKSQAARQALGVLPYSNIRLEETASFISRTGDYLRSLSLGAAKGIGYTDDDREALRSLSQGARHLADRLQELEAGILSGSAYMGSATEAEELLSREDGAVTRGAGQDLSVMEEQFPEIPTLVYDGPFSDHIASSTPKHIEGKKELSREDILFVAAEFTGLDRSDFTVEYQRDAPVPVYVLSAETKSGNIVMEITKQGGFVNYYGYDRPVMFSQYSAEECVKTAEAFLRQRGIESMVSTYHTVQDNAVLVSFAYQKDDVTYYPDLVKVAVTQDSREVVTFESAGYIMNHHSRDLSSPKVSPEEAKKHISPELTVISDRLTVIPTLGKNEVLCYEFLTQNRDGQHILVYVNCETGYEEQILILLEDENGTLTV